MPKSLADGHVKVAVLTTKPADPSAPTVAELAAGINAACNILASDFAFTAADSDKVAEKPLCQVNNANALGPSNFNAAMTVFRHFDEVTGLPHATEDALFEAVKVKGTELWVYAREDGNLESEAWAAGQEIYLGMHLLTDEPQKPSDNGGYIKRRVPMEPQEGWPSIEVAA